MTMYLLDTQAFIWLSNADPRLSPTARRAITAPDSILYLSLASVWEMQIKIQIGKLQMRASLQQVLREEQAQNDIRLLPITLPDIWSLGNLPLIHRDPFDRLLIAQARLKNFTIISADAMFSSYAVTVVW
ncbi:MAG: type II toxin-antitoxin system VapC family toxin [Anaerolineae bacterium]|nr:type II toxin-antitoxin system VapC family toxin [Anaerolineae bacterium]